MFKLESFLQDVFGDDEEEEGEAIREEGSRKEDSDSDLGEPIRKSKGKRSKPSSKSVKSSKKRRSTRNASDIEGSEGETKAIKGSEVFPDSDDEDAHIEVISHQNGSEHVPMKIPGRPAMLSTLKQGHVFLLPENGSYRRKRERK